MFPGIGILLQLALGAAALAVGAVLVARAVRRRARGRALAGGGLIACVALYAAGAGATGVDQWNPAHVSPEALAGTWTAGDSRLELLPDGTFRIDARGGAAERVELSRAEGRWELRDWNLTLRTGDGAAHALRVVVSGGTYRIIESPGDLDAWTAWSGFGRTPPSPAPACETC